MNKSKNAKLNIGDILDKSLGLDKIPIEYEYDLPDGTFDEPVGGYDNFYPENDDIIIGAGEEYESIDEMIANADSVDDMDNYQVEDVNNDKDEFDEISMTYDSDSLDPEVAVINENAYALKETSYLEDLPEDAETAIYKAIYGEDFAKNFNESKDKSYIDDKDGADIDKILGGGTVEPNNAEELPVLESAAESALRQQRSGQGEEGTSTAFNNHDVRNHSINDKSLYSADVNAGSGFSDISSADGEFLNGGRIVDKPIGEQFGGVGYEGKPGIKYGELPTDEIPEFLKEYIDSDIAKKINETEKQGKSAVAGDKKMDENKTMDNEIKKDSLTENVDLAVASSLVDENTNKDEGVFEGVQEKESVVIVEAKNKAEANSVVNEQIKKSVNNNIEKSPKDGVVRVCVDDGSVVCDVCGHLNKNASGVCEMCSNYLKVRR